MRRLSDLIRPTRRTLRSLGPADREAAIQWMAARPATSAFLLGWVHQFGMPSLGKNRFFEIYTAGEAPDWTAMILVVNGALISAVEGTPEHGEALGESLQSRGYQIQTAVGPDAFLEAFMTRFCGANFRPRVNQAQCVMLRERATPIEHTPYPPRLLQRAVQEDAAELIDASLRMHEEEVGRPNSPSDITALRRSALHKTRGRRVWIYRDPQSKELLFKASISLPTPLVVQIEGVWTAPHARGQGIARDCMAQMIATLHQDYRYLALTVGRDNQPAIALYRRLGFATVCDWRTAYLDNEPAVTDDLRGAK